MHYNKIQDNTILDNKNNPTYYNIRQDKTMQDKTSHDNTMWYKTIQDKTRQDNAIS